MKVSIVGITGYSGLELVKILNNHKNIRIHVHHTLTQSCALLEALT